jgi:hypothetical protein
VGVLSQIDLGLGGHPGCCTVTGTLLYSPSSRDHLRLVWQRY